MEEGENEAHHSYDGDEWEVGAALGCKDIDAAGRRSPEAKPRATIVAGKLRRVE